MRKVRWRSVGLAGLMVAVLFSLCAGAAPAFGSSVWWGLTSGSWPATLAPGGKGKVVITAQNRGYGTVDATDNPVVVKDLLPPGLDAVAVEAVAGEKVGEPHYQGGFGCLVVTTREVECRYEGEEKSGAHRVLPPYEELEVRVTVRVAESAGATEMNVVRVGGGGASGEASLEREMHIGAQPAGFGIEDAEMMTEEEGGAVDTQAGSHPFQMTNYMALNVSEVAENAKEQMPAAMVKDLTVQLPAGLIGNPTVVPQCTEAQFTTAPKDDLTPNGCAPETAVGVVTATYNAPGGTAFNTQVVPLFNLTPGAGEPARFGFEPVQGTRVYLDTAVRTGSDYGVTVSIHNVVQLDGFLAAKTTFWGVPGAAVHDSARGWRCLEGPTACSKTNEGAPEPLLSLPTSCDEPLRGSVQVDSWAEPHPLNPLQAPLFANYTMASMDGCNQIHFKPEVSVAPEEPYANTPTGFDVSVSLPQAAASNSETLAEGAIRDTTVALPVGVSLNPGGSVGLGACPIGTNEGIGYLGAKGPNEELLFTGRLPVPLEPGRNFCSNESKVGTVTIDTPVLTHPIEGAVYLATPDPLGAVELGDNPFNALIALYIVAEDPVSGVLVKLAGRVQICESAGEAIGGFSCQAAGQMVSVFENTPQVPVERLDLQFFGGEHPALLAPASCSASGVPYVTQALFTSWSAPGGAPRAATSGFEITSGPNGGPCPTSPAPFKPEFEAGSVNIAAGAATELLTTIGHPDLDQPLGGVSVTLPPGLMGSLADVRLCQEPQAALGTCGPESLIGHTLVTAGVGAHPLVVKRPGNVYITGPYNGHGGCAVGEAGCAPFGLSIASSAEAGPFDLAKGTPCDCVLVRAKVWVNPHTTQLSVETGALPTVLHGIPLHLQHVQLQTKSEGFVRNPTNCSMLKVTGTVTSSQGAAAAVSAPFEVGNCASLPFKPTFHVATHAVHTRRYGAYLHVAVGSSAGQANIKSVLVKLPKVMPSRQETLKLACSAAQFAANPSGCPADSHVGYAVAHTPVLPVPLTGPAMFVSHGGAGFPDLDIVLQGYGVTVDLTGSTNIINNVTSSDFRAVPDVPVSSFELTLPPGPHAALTATANLCKVKAIKRVKIKRHGKTIHRRRTVTRKRRLVMPTTITGQNGAVIKTNTAITVIGCRTKVKRHGRRRQKHDHRAKKQRK